MISRQKILIVDDKRENLVALRTVLRDVDVEIIEALSGNDALAATLDHRFALAILDVMMPGMNGFELAEHLRNDDTTQLLPVIFVTALQSDEQHLFSGYEAGGVDYIVKPYNPQILLAKVRIFLELDRQRQELQWQRDHLELMVAERTRELELELSERKRVEADLKKTTEILELTGEIAKIGGWDLDLVSNRMSFSKAACRINDVDPSVGLSLDQAFEMVHPEDRTDHQAAVENSVKNGTPWDRELRMTTVKGRHIWVRTQCVPVIENGKTVRLQGCFQDITRFKRAEEEKHLLESQLQQAQKMESVGRLAGGVAHDFNNMLGVILGHAELGLMKTAPDDPVQVDFKEISKTAERSADLTRQLLTFARKQTVMPKIIDLNDTVTSMLKMLQRLIGEDIHLSWQPSPEHCQVKMDPSQIDQILANLCVNARDAIEDTGRITIETGTRSIDPDYCTANPEATPGDYVRLVVSDDGKGMDRETQAHIFEPFFTTKEMGKGTGLGLATVYGAVKQNNGFINIYSEPGKGTTFSIYLPRETDLGTARRAQADAEIAVPRGQETILLVEDEPAILNITSLMLEKQGYSVLKANTPGEALRLAREHPGAIHLLMTDVIMPEMNGRDLAGNILALHPGIKRLFMSGYTADVIAHHGVLDKGVHFIQKPFSLPNMAAKVREVLDKS